MKISMMHGSGGEETSRLISEVFMSYFGNEHNASMEDAAILNCPEKIALTTDSFVVQPLFFAGGDIGRLSICGTVNDLLTTGAKPLYLTAGFILEEGLDSEILRGVCKSMALTADEAGVKIVAGDTKVVEGDGELYINTAGVGGFYSNPVRFSDARSGDAIIVTGTLGDHHACILSARMGIENNILSDNAPLGDIVNALQGAGITLHGMRDITRGGLATILTELNTATGLSAVVSEADLPISDEVAVFAKILGLDPLTMGNEGKLIIIVPEGECSRALEVIRKAPYGKNAACIGFLEDGGVPVIHTKLGGRRIITPLRGEGLPRIC